MRRSFHWLHRACGALIGHLLCWMDAEKPFQFGQLKPIDKEAAVEDVDLRAARGLDRALFQTLAAGDCTGIFSFGTVQFPGSRSRQGKIACRGKLCRGPWAKPA